MFEEHLRMVQSVNGITNVGGIGTNVRRNNFKNATDNTDNTDSLPGITGEAFSVVILSPLQLCQSEANL